MTITLTEARQLPHGQKINAVGGLREYNRRNRALRLEDIRKRNRDEAIKKRKEDDVYAEAGRAQNVAVYRHLVATSDRKKVRARAVEAGLAAGEKGSREYRRAWGRVRYQALCELGDHDGALEKGREAFVAVMQAAGRDVRNIGPCRRSHIPLEELAEQERAAAAKL